ncbi:putative zinc-binding protein [Clostridiales Family XIII bacterium ASD5510]|uniref:Zinc-binding protein n=2 Tax=Bacteria TaxID=2 RepID=A0A9J6QV11_9FIRM|nr:putative zinc-binding protein [Hominibacterium faecale]MCU7378947.1 putative zinc-binding protein [Hominibacterium faecale]
MENPKIGVISCSGEECLGGTLSRMATRKVMDELRSGEVVSLCLPLYIARGGEDREFAKKHPVIAVDGCEKCCAKEATIKYSGEVKDAVVITDLIGDTARDNEPISMRHLRTNEKDMVDQVAKEICRKVDSIYGR